MNDESIEINQAYLYYQSPSNEGLYRLLIVLTSPDLISTTNKIDGLMGNGSMITLSVDSKSNSSIEPGSYKGYSTFQKRFGYNSLTSSEAYYSDEFDGDEVTIELSESNFSDRTGEDMAVITGIYRGDIILFDK